jgi:hypothetical protein
MKNYLSQVRARVEWCFLPHFIPFIPVFLKVCFWVPRGSWEYLREVCEVPAAFMIILWFYLPLSLHWRLLWWCRISYKSAGTWAWAKPLAPPEPSGQCLFHATISSAHKPVAVVNILDKTVK